MEIKINKKLKVLLENSYRGEHEAPDESFPSLDDLSGAFPNDIYSSDAARLYGECGGCQKDRESINVIQSAKGRPRKMVKIYRAVPNFTKELDEKIKGLSRALISYHNPKFGSKSLPFKNSFVSEFDKKYRDDKGGVIPIEKGEINYDEYQEMIANEMTAELDRLEKLKKQSKKPKIQAGDWVTLSKTYAKEHGEGNLNDYKIISMTVPASTLNTEGNSIHEWGYNP